MSSKRRVIAAVSVVCAGFGALVLLSGTPALTQIESGFLEVELTDGTLPVEGGVVEIRSFDPATGQFSVVEETITPPDEAELELGSFVAVLVQAPVGYEPTPSAAAGVPLLIAEVEEVVFLALNVIALPGSPPPTTVPGGPGPESTTTAPDLENPEPPLDPNDPDLTVETGPSVPAEPLETVPPEEALVDADLENRDFEMTFGEDTIEFTVDRVVGLIGVELSGTTDSEVVIPDPATALPEDVPFVVIAAETALADFDALQLLVDLDEPVDDEVVMGAAVVTISVYEAAEVVFITLPDGVAVAVDEDTGGLTETLVVGQPQDLQESLGLEIEPTAIEDIVP